MPNGTSLIYLENLAVGLKRIHGEIKKPYSGQNPSKPTVRAFTILIISALLHVNKHHPLDNIYEILI